MSYRIKGLFSSHVSRTPLITTNLSLPPYPVRGELRREFSMVRGFWIPAGVYAMQIGAGMTFWKQP